MKPILQDKILGANKILALKRKKRGRPRQKDKVKVITALLEHRHEIIHSDGKVMNKDHPVWENISNRIGNTKTPRSLYTYVTCNQDNVRQMMCPGYSRDASLDTLNCSQLDASGNVSSADSTFNATKRIRTPLAFSISIHLTLKSFNKIVEIRDSVKKLKKDLWQPLICDNVWEKTRRTCGYTFKFSYLNADGASGLILGECSCGSQLECTISNANHIVTIECSASRGDPLRKCSKRPYRGPQRVEMAKKLEKNPAYVVQIELINERMRYGDNVCPLVPDLTVLRTLKCQTVAAKRLDSDPVTALEKMQEQKMERAISIIERDPFRVCYATENQIDIHKKLAKIFNSCLLLDSTGGISRPIRLADGSKSGPVYFYQALLFTPIGHIPAAQMLSSRHTTRTVLTWLMNLYDQLELPPPKEYIVDGARCLIAAGVRAFTDYSTINEYADSFLKGHRLPPCWIRIDVAHFLKKYAKLLKNVNRDVAAFFKALIGKLILCRTVDQAERILLALLIIALSETSGLTADGHESACDKAFKSMEQLLTTSVDEELNIDEVDASDEDSEEEGSSNYSDIEDSDRDSLWYQWGKKIEVKAMTEIEAGEGTEKNPYFQAKFVKQVLTDIQWIPLWSCIYRESFGYGRCPASSAGVEAMFGILKTLLLNNYTLPLPADVFVDLNEDFLEAITTSFYAKLQEELKTTNAEQVISDDEKSSEQSFFEAAFIPDDTDNGQPAMDIPDIDQLSHIPPLSNSSPIFGHPKETESKFHLCKICHTQMDQAGQKCSKCSTMDDQRNESLQDSQHSQKVQHKGYFLRESYPPRTFAMKAHVKKIPFMKPAHDSELKAVRKNSQLIDLQHTSSFDSLFQLFFTLAIDDVKFCSNVIENYKKSNHFLSLIGNKCLKKTRMNSATYTERYTILGQIFQDRKVVHKLQEDLETIVIDCQCQISFMCRTLFDNVLNCSKVFNCTAGCKVNKKELPCHEISLGVLQQTTCKELVIGRSESNETMDKCASSGCPGFIESVEIIPGDFFLVMNRDELAIPQTMTLKEIPKKLIFDADTTTAHTFNLKGIIHRELVQYSKSRTRGNKEHQVLGNYQAYSLRNDAWMSHGVRMVQKKENTKVYPELLLYAK